MKKYLIRADFDPLVKPEPTDFVGKSFVGANSGNLMFAYGVMNVLRTENTELNYTYKWKFTDEEVEAINQTYDAFILPMADAFRTEFIKKLQGYTDLFMRIRIPVVIAGIGLRADYEPDFSSGFKFDEAARNFVKAALDKSAIIGLRGEITADYLSYLGFTPEKDFTPIGCPSLYTYGNSVKTREPGKNISKIAVNTNGYYNVGFINDFLLKTIREIPDYYLVQQLQNEYHDMFIGNGWIPYLLRGSAKKQEKYIIKGSTLEKLYKNDRVRYFFDVPSWINFIKSFDMFIGNRFHGSVAAVLAGTPYLMIPFNARTREMTEYHHLTSLSPDAVKKDTSVLDYIETLDFHSFETHQKDNLEHYISFLEKNGLEHIFREKTSYKMGESILEQAIQRSLDSPINEYCFTVHDYKSLSAIGKVQRSVICNYKTIRREVLKLKRRKAALVQNHNNRAEKKSVNR